MTFEDDTSDSTPSRRTFLKASVGASTTAIVAGCAAPAAERKPGERTTGTPPNSPKGTVERLDAYPTVKIASLSDLDAGELLTFEYPLEGQQNFLTKLGDEAWGGVGPDNDVVAFNSRCTHAGCSVTGQVVPEESRAGPCPCHFTSFDLAKGGLVVLGQATTDLPQIDLKVEDGDVYATGIDSLVWGYHDNLRSGEPTPAVEQVVEGDDAETTGTER